ncbi:MAG: hypothetical protein IJ785_05870 [Bacteroidales bacterium]|nr:hypothetical protein [Bacteroidales bacterium]
MKKRCTGNSLHAAKMLPTVQGASSTVQQTIPLNGRKALAQQSPVTTIRTPTAPQGFSTFQR